MFSHSQLEGHRNYCQPVYTQEEVRTDAVGRRVSRVFCFTILVSFTSCNFGNGSMRVHIGSAIVTLIKPLLCRDTIQQLAKKSFRA